MPLVLVAALGLAWCAWFWPWFRNQPDEMAQVNRLERKLIESGRAARRHRRAWRGSLGADAAVAERLVALAHVRIPRIQRQFLPHAAADLSEEPSAHRLRRSTAWLTSLPFAFGVVACFAGGSLSDASHPALGKASGKATVVGVAGLTLAGLAIPAVPWVDRVEALGFLLVLAFFGNDLAMAPAWASAADIGERHTGTLAGAMNMMASFMAAVEALAVGRLLDANDLIMPFVLLALSYALGTWPGSASTCGVRSASRVRRRGPRPHGNSRSDCTSAGSLLKCLVRFG